MLADAWGRRYGRRPSELLLGEDAAPELGNAVDMLCLEQGVAEDMRRAAKSKAIPAVLVGGL